MKIVQSLLTKPLYKVLQRPAAQAGGWPHARYYFMSWAYSCLQLSKYYRRLELVTDSLGSEWLVTQLKLPYSDVKVCLDNIDLFHDGLWGVSKIYAYGLQTEPFLHVDNDVFIWERFPERIENAPLAIQHYEMGYEYYTGMFEMVRSLKSVPTCLVKHVAVSEAIDACNLGIAGGQMFEFYHKFRDIVFEFLEINRKNIHTMPINQISVFIEQVIFFCLAKATRIQIEPMFYSLSEQEADKEIQSVKRFARAPAFTRFIHLYGNCKKNIFHCHQLEYRMKKEYPHHYQLVLELCEQQPRPVILESDIFQKLT